MGSTFIEGLWGSSICTCTYIAVGLFRGGLKVGFPLYVAVQMLQLSRREGNTGRLTSLVTSLPAPTVRSVSV